jgi:signal transduction histidine kinase
MNIKRIILIIVIAFLACTGLTIFSFRVRRSVDIDVVAVNDMTQTLAKQWEGLEKTGLPDFPYSYDYVVLDNDGALLKATRRGLKETINAAVSHRDTIADISRNNKLLGKLIIYNDSADRLEYYRQDIQVCVMIILLIVGALSICFTVYYDRKVFRPFRRLQSFARQVAEGKLDMPLEMDKGNMFGAFTESFDLMRDEINLARENERKANQSKRELVASLSHDIKTPIASIKAVSEVMYARTGDDTVKNQIGIINSKADQINTLITNLFSATLEELQELKVTVTEEPSGLIYELINKADYNKQVTISRINECLILADELRLAQVIDNIISNSYKYAGTSIEVTTQVRGKFLEVTFKDFGPGVPEEERPLIFNKFYRAKNAGNKSGTGLGLYISKYIVNKMSGEIDCENTDDGFAVKLKLKMI